jgi:hypothetical protein
MAKRRAKPLTKAKAKSKLAPKSKSKAKAKSKAKPKSNAKSRLSRALTSGRVTRRDPSWLIVEGPLDKLVDAAARALILPLEPAWKPAIKTNLDVTLRLAASFADFPLPDDAEPAPVFVA